MFPADVDPAQERNVGRVRLPGLLGILLLCGHRSVTSLKMTSNAKTVEAYLASLPDDRREAITAVRETILKNLDSGYREGVQYGMIGYVVPHSLFPAGYHCDPSKPLCYAGLASQKNYMSVYLMCIYGSKDHAKWFHDAWKKTGKKLDAGKCCIRFKKVDDLALDVIGEAIRRVPAKKYIESYQNFLDSRKTKSGNKPARSAKPAAAKRKTKAR